MYRTRQTPLHLAIKPAHTGRCPTLTVRLLLLIISFAILVDSFCTANVESVRGDLERRLLADVSIQAAGSQSAAATPPSSTLAPGRDDRPELHNGIGDVDVWVYGDDTVSGRGMLERVRKHCSSKARLLTSTTGHRWNYWHDKMNRLLREDIRQLPNSRIVMLLDSDVDCFPCTRSIADEFRKFDAGVVALGYPFDQAPTPWKSGWFPPYQLLEEYKSPEEDHMKHSLSLFRFLNAGTMVAYAGALKYYLSQYYLMTGFVDRQKFDDQSDFWANMYLAQEYSPWNRGYNSGVAVQGQKQGLPNRAKLYRIAIDAEGSIFQLALLYYKGRWMRTERGLQRELPYRKEVCVLHFLSSKPGMRYINNTALAAAAVGTTLFGSCPASPTDTSINWRNESTCICKVDWTLMVQLQKAGPRQPWL